MCLKPLDLLWFLLFDSIDAYLTTTISLRKIRVELPRSRLTDKPSAGLFLRLLLPMASARPGSAAAGPAAITSAAPTAAGQNIKVAVRLRPFNKREKALNAKRIIDVEGGKSIKITDPSSSAKPDEEGKLFVFDHAYDWDSPQSALFNDVADPIVEQAFRGFNATIFAYGQTGSGKTWSMQGNSEEPGIIPQLNASLFRRVAEMRDTAAKAAKETVAAATSSASDSGTDGSESKPTAAVNSCKASSPPEFLVTVSYLEIYNEVVKDLLNPTDKQLSIREHPELGVYVQDLAEIVVASVEDINRLIEQGQRVRHVAATQMNERSSRSHSCLTIRVEQRTSETTATKTRTTTTSAKINLVDLAGSERASKTGATGDVLKQGAAINKSLSALGNVINALAEGKKGHVPYRDSKLTRLLQHSLGGNSLTCMIAAISPADDNYDETMSTLQYANRAKNIKNDARRNEDVNETLIRQLRDEIEALRRALAAAQAGGGGGVGGLLPDGTAAPQLSDAQKAQMEEMIANLERAKQQSWEEKQRLSGLYEQERQRNLENENRIRSVMQTLKEDNVELIRRMKVLVNDRARLVKHYKKLKREHAET